MPSGAERGAFGALHVFGLVSEEKLFGHGVKLSLGGFHLDMRIYDTWMVSNWGNFETQ